MNKLLTGTLFSIQYVMWLSIFLTVARPVLANEASKKAFLESAVCVQDLLSKPVLQPNQISLIQNQVRMHSAMLSEKLKAESIAQDQYIRSLREETVPPREQIPAKLRPKDKEIENIAVYANKLLQDQKVHVEFFNRVYSDVLTLKFAAGKSAEIIHFDGKVSVDGLGAKVLANIAHEQGWGAIEVSEKNFPPAGNEFRHRLAPGRLFYDVPMTTIGHTGTAHILQFLMITPYIDKKFGVGATRRLMQYMGTEEGYELWPFLCDKPPHYFRDSRGSIFFGWFNWTVSTGDSQPASFFGVD